MFMWCHFDLWQSTDLDPTLEGAMGGVLAILLQNPLPAQVLESSDKNVGYNAATGTYEDLLKAGIIDPVKVLSAVLCACGCESAVLLAAAGAWTPSPDLHLSAACRHVRDVRTVFSHSHVASCLPRTT